MSFAARQAIIGVVFGGIAIVGTEFGIDASGATVNVRDAAPIVAGLMFGGPAGIAAGLIGGVERWFAALWGRGAFTRVACSVATCAAGFYAALLRKYMFDGKKPTPVFGFAIGLVIEVLHLTLIFITNMGEIERSITVVRICTMPMLLGNGLAVMLATIALTLLGHERVKLRPEERDVSQQVQGGMLVMVLIAFVATSGFSIVLQRALSDQQTFKLLSLNIQDVRNDIISTGNKGVVGVAQVLADEIGSLEAASEERLAELVEVSSATELSVVDDTGTIVRSTNDSYVGFDLSTDTTFSSFLALLDGAPSEVTQNYQTAPRSRESLRKYVGVPLDGGFLLTSYSVEDFQAQFSTVIAGITEYRHVGEEGSLVVCDAADEVVSARESIEGDSLEGTGMAASVRNARAGSLFRTTFLGVPVYGMVQEAEGYRIIAVLPESEAHFSRNASVLIGSFMEIIVLAALFAVIYFLIRSLVVNNIRTVNTTLGVITNGDLEATVDVHTSVEFSSLSDDINLMVAALKQAIADASARIDAELEYARRIQQSALPLVFPPYPSHTEFEIFASMDPAKEVGGDFYDFYLLDDDHLAFLIADVSGKGIPAALFMMTAKTLLKSLAESDLPVEQVLTRSNAQLCENNEAEMFVTCWMGVLDLRTGHVEFANAGHNPPVVAHAGGPFDYYVKRPNLVLAGMPGIRYMRHEMDLAPGDTLFLYTDGVTEATNAENELFGEERLLVSLAARASSGVEELCKGVHADVNSFVADAPQFDDITVLALRYEGGDSREAEGQG